MCAKRQTPPAVQTRDPVYVAVIGDLIGSRRLTAPARRKAQAALQSLLSGMNRKYAKWIRSGFKIAMGDQFEGLFDASWAQQILPDLIWMLEENLSCQIRLGVGIGRVDTELADDPGLVDGPAFHRARSAVDRADREMLQGGVFEGFGGYDAVLNGLARLLHELRSGWSDRQRQLVGLLKQELSMTVAADSLKISKQAVSGHAKAAGWKAYREGELAFCHAIGLAYQTQVRAGEAQE